MAWQVAWYVDQSCFWMTLHTDSSLSYWFLGIAEAHSDVLSIFYYAVGSQVGNATLIDTVQVKCPWRVIKLFHEPLQPRWQRG